MRNRKHFPGTFLALNAHWIGFKMEELKAKARKDFAIANLMDHEWPAFWKGYLLAVKRFAQRS